MNRKNKSAVIVCVAALVLTGCNSPAEKYSQTVSEAENRISEGDYSGAAEEFQKALELDPSDARVYIELADTYLANGNIDKAIETLRKGSEAANDPTLEAKLNDLLKEKSLTTARQNLESDNFETALEQFNTVIELDDSCTEAYFGSAEVLAALDRLDEAEELLQKGYEKTQDEELNEKLKELSTTRSMNLAEQYMLEKNYSLALTEYQNALSVNDKLTEAYIGAVNALEALGETDKVLEQLRIGVDKTDDKELKQMFDDMSVISYLKTAKNYFSEQKYEFAKTEYENALEVNDKCVDAYIGASDSYVRLGKANEAIDILRSGFEKTHDETVGEKLNKLEIADLTRKNRTNLENKKYDEAAENFREILKLDSENITAYIGLADAYCELDDYNNAVDILETGINKTKDKRLEEKLTEINLSTALSHAQDYLSSGKFSDAAAEFKNALNIDSANVEAYMGLTDTYLNLGDTDAALTNLREGYEKTNDEALRSRLNELSFSTSLSRANCYLSRGEYSKARDEFQNALNLDSSCVEAYLGQADAYFGLGDVSSANNVLQNGWAATWDSRIQSRLFRGRLNNLTLNPQKCGYEPLNQLVEQILNSITTNDMDTYDKVKACYDYLINNCVYGQGDGIYDVLEFDDMYSDKSLYEKFAYIILRDHEGVCDYYSAAFAVMTRAIGLDTKVRGGQTSTARTESGYTGHAWCVIIIDGVEYVFDPQVEDNIAKGGAIGYYRFCKTYDEVKNNYIPSFWVDM